MENDIQVSNTCGNLNKLSISSEIVDEPGKKLRTTRIYPHSAC